MFLLSNREVINEPVFRYSAFIMCSREEVRLILNVKYNVIISASLEFRQLSYISAHVFVGLYECSLNIMWM